MIKDDKGILLLLEADRLLLKEGENALAKKFPAVCIRILEAAICEVWVREKCKWRLCAGYPSSRKKITPPMIKENLSDRKKQAVFLQSGGDKRFQMLLPFWQDNTLCGCIKVEWAQEPDYSLAASAGLSAITCILAKIYFLNPAFTRSTKRENTLLALYRDTDEKLENYKKNTSLELHDEIGQVLTSILLQLRLLQQTKDIDYIRQRLGGLHTITHGALEEVRRISRDLRPYVLEKYGLRAAIEAHVKDFVELTGIEVEFRCNDNGDLQRELEESVENVLYRILQEGLTNVARHSGASKAVVTLSIKNNEVLLQILDYGKGISKDSPAGLGLLGMEERAKLVGGRFWLVSEERAGVSLNALLPCQKEESTHVRS